MFGLWLSALREVGQPTGAQGSAAQDFFQGPGQAPRYVVG